MDNDHHIGERIALQRRQRGLSQTVLAGLVGRSESWLSQVERGQRNVDKLSILIPMAKALRVDLAVLLGEPLDFSHQGGPDLAAVDAIRAAISTYVTLDGEDERDIPDAVTLGAVLVEINSLNQATQYDRAGTLLPLAIRSAELAAEQASNTDQQREALALVARTHQVTAALLSRIGQTDLGWVAADRAINAAKRADDTELLIAGVYRLGQIMLRPGRDEEVFQLAESVLPSTDPGNTRPSMLSLH
ncbi:MAG: helix-turn-helix transcriptional regulator, partial [bacterium]|nr:helix-turn-helix transcriptional regulator [bacterium]